MTTRANRQGSSVPGRIFVALLVAVIVVPGGRAAADDELASLATADLQASVPGTLFICGGGRIPEPAVKKFVECAGGPSAHIVVVTTASETADTPDVEPRLEPWRRLTSIAELTILHTRSREIADDPEFTRPLASATGVWFIGGHQERLTDAYLGTRAEAMIHKVVERGGVVGGTSAGAAIMSPVMIRGGIAQPEISRGFGFLPGTVVDQHFLKRKRETRLVQALKQFPRCVGLGIDEGTVLVVQGRRLTVLDGSESNVLAYFAPVEGQPAKVTRLAPGDEADLVALRRAALARVEPRQRPTAPMKPDVGHGTLVIAGGGDVPEEAARRFIEAAGGPDAHIVVVSTASGDPTPSEDEITGWLRSAGARNVRQIHPRTPRQADDPSILSLLREAGGVWFAGGRQWRLVDAFSGTAAEKLLHALLVRGGAIGGSAAGASSLADYLVRGSPISNSQVMCDGYEDGFCFLAGTAIDPYFTKRNRFADMLELKRAHPQLIGLGVDVATALIVTGSVLEVVGQNHVAVYGRREPAPAGEREFDLLYAGDRYSLQDRQRLGPPRADASTESESEGAGGGDGSATSAEVESSDEPAPQPALVCQ